MEGQLPKYEFTLKLRQQVRLQCHGLRETDRTEPDLTALSYENDLAGDRSVWESAYNHKAKGIIVDLEERVQDSDDRTTIRQIKAASPKEVVNIIRNWFEGNSQPSPA